MQILVFSVYICYSILTEKENNPEVFEELDGVTKSEIFKTKNKSSNKIEVTAALKSPLTSKVKPQTSKANEKKSASPLQADFNIVATSSELFSESTEMSDVLKEGKIYF